MTNLMDVPSYKSSKKCFYLMNAQEWTGIEFDKPKAEALLVFVEQAMLVIENEIEPKLPPRPLKKGEQHDYTVPAKPFKKDGTPSAHMINFLAKFPGSSLDEDGVMTFTDGLKYKVVGKLELPGTMPMKLKNQTDLKAWLLEDCGWVPTLWNVKKDERGKPLRDDKTGNLINTTPKFQENGRLCPNLELLQGDLVHPVVEWLSFRNRRSVVEGWMANPRLEFDGRLSAGSSGLASSHRQRHTNVVNVPKAEDGVRLGKEMRDLFKARDGYVLVGYDAAALEARVEAHYTTKFVGGEAYAYELLNGDIHLKTAESVFAKHLGSVIGTPDFHKDHPLVKPWRSKAKGLKYATSYGASANKLAKMLNVCEREGREIFEAFWEAASPLADLKEQLTLFWETTGEKKWILGIDGRRLYSRSRHSLVNLLFQSCGAISMDTSLLFMDKWLGGLKRDSIGSPCYVYKGYTVYRIGYFHDEAIWECPPNIATEVGQLGVKSIKQAGKYLKLRVDLDGEAKIGSSWRDTH